MAVELVDEVEERRRHDDGMRDVFASRVTG